ncbi:MAG TPA: hypothetical protein VNX25_10265 [Verrucomicrobiae bacterium]|nr:hypothetical protein [Verrucomicrobiae bacterium]
MSGNLCIKNRRGRCLFAAPRCGGYVLEFRTSDQRHVLRSEPYETVAEAMEAMKVLSRDMKDLLIAGVHAEQPPSWPGIVATPCPAGA